MWGHSFQLEVLNFKFNNLKFLLQNKELQLNGLTVKMEVFHQTLLDQWVKTNYMLAEQFAHHRKVNQHLAKFILPGNAYSLVGEAKNTSMNNTKDYQFITPNNNNNNKLAHNKLAIQD